MDWVGSSLLKTTEKQLLSQISIRIIKKNIHLIGKQWDDDSLK